MAGAQKILAVVVTYNGAKWIRRCLKTLLNSSFDSCILHVVVIDNNSDDDTAGIVDGLKNDRIRKVSLAENLGFGAANNIGFEIALNEDYDFVLLINQDVYVESLTIQQLVDALLQDTVTIISPLHLTGDGCQLDSNFMDYIAPSNCPELISDKFIGYETSKIYVAKFINAACWLMTINCVRSIGGFNPIFYHYGKDVDYINRLHHHGGKIGVLPNSRIYHDRSRTPKDLGDLTQLNNFINYFKQYLADPSRKSTSIIRFMAMVFLKSPKSFFNPVVVVKRVYWILKLRNRVAVSRKVSSQRGPNYLKVSV
jgi:GT2 family glycosyltransferase